MPTSAGNLGATIAIVLATLLGCVAQGSALTLQQRQSDNVMQKRLGLPLSAIEQRRRMQDFQQEQRRYRAQDRRNALKPRTNTVIPRVRPTCQNQIYGNEYLRRRNCP
jgi:hypothetical protein